LDNAFEYIIKQKNEGKVLLKKVLLILLYAAIAILLTAVTLAYASIAVFIPMAVFIIALTAALAFVTWRFVSIEYEISIGGGDMIITKIYGKSIRKTLLNIEINSFSEIGVYDDSAYEEISKLSIQQNLLCLSSLAAPDVYYGIYEEGQDRCIIYFDAPERAVELLKKTNSGAFRASDKRMKAQQQNRKESEQ